MNASTLLLLRNSLIATLIVVATGNGLLAQSEKERSREQPVTIEQQIARSLTYPQRLRDNTENSVVVVQFRLDERNRVKNPQIFSADPLLNAELIRQIAHLKLNPTEPIGYVEQVYTARLRFRVNEKDQPLLAGR